MNSNSISLNRLYTLKRILTFELYEDFTVNTYVNAAVPLQN